MNILVLTGKILPLNSGDAHYAYGIVKELSKFNKVYVISAYDDLKNNVMDTSDYKELKNMVGDIQFISHSLNKKPLLKRVYMNLFKVKMVHLFFNVEYLERSYEFIEKYKIDCVIFEHLRVSGYYKYIFKRFKGNLKYILNEQDSEFINQLEVARGKKNIFAKLANYHQYMLLKKYEKHIINKMDNVLVISKNDVVLLKERLKIRKRMIVNKPLVYFEQGKTHIDLNDFNKKLLIVGSMSWYPNISGTIWFVEKVLNKLIKIDKEWKLYIVGTNPTQEIMNLEGKYKENVIVTGRVPDTKEYFKNCDISIVPVFQGTGVKIKLLESIARGIPTISTSFAAKDFDLVDEVLICDDEDEIIKRILEIEENKALRLWLHNNSLKYYKDYMQLSTEIKKIFMGQEE